MDDVTLQGVQILLILLPGFVTLWIISSLTARPSMTDFDKIIEALFYSFVVYFILIQIPYNIPPIAFSLVRENGGDPRMAIDLAALRRFVVFGLGVSVVLGLTASFLITHDILTKGLRWARITQRTSRMSVWSDVFHDITTYVIVELKDGRRLRGWPRYFSDSPQEGSVFLERAAWVLDDGAVVEIQGPGILITNNNPIETVSFLSPAPPS